MRSFFVALTLLATAIALEAKGTTVKLTLTGAGLAAPWAAGLAKYSAAPRSAA